MKDEQRIVTISELPNGYRNIRSGFNTTTRQRRPSNICPYPCEINIPPVALPAEPQAFHEELGSQYEYQYSRCTGRRIALLIGINYIGFPNELHGCINDAIEMKFFLNRYGFRDEDMVLLSDDQWYPCLKPTKANIIRAMNWLVQNAQPNDSLFFHYSGHGGQSFNWNSNQDDVYNETIYPVDYREQGEISNNEMHAIMVRPLPPGCRLTALFDCCHSGSALSLPYEYGASGLKKEPNILKEAGRGLLETVKCYAKGDIQHAITDAVSIVKLIVRPKEERDEIRRTMTSPADVIQLSGCKNYETSTDTVEAVELPEFLSDVRERPLVP